MNRAYLKHFTFQASRYEEYVDGVCLSKGNCNTIVVSKPISHDCVAFNLVNEVPVKIWDHFELPVLGYAGGDVLKDRIQYGRLNTLKWHDPTEPIVCNIFNNMTCIRFATLSPLRTVNFAPTPETPAWSILSNDQVAGAVATAESISSPVVASRMDTVMSHVSSSCLRR